MTHLTVPGPSQQWMGITPLGSPRAPVGMPLTPRTETRRTQAMVMSYSSRFQAQSDATHSPFKKRIYQFLKYFSFFIEHDCCSCKAGKLKCCAQVRLVDIKESVQTMKNCAKCYSGCVTLGLCCATAGVYGCYECYALQKDRVAIHPQ